MDIDYLRKNIIDSEDQRPEGVASPLQPYYHGLGCIRLCMKDGTFINFYSKKYIPEETKYIHTHRENFYSKSIHGEYDNVIYDVFVDDNSPYRLDYIECWPGGKTQRIFDNVNFTELTRMRLTEESEMLHLYNDYHDLELVTDHCITRVTFDLSPPYPIEQRGSIYPKIVWPIGDRDPNAANNYGDEEDNWQIIREILNEV